MIRTAVSLEHWLTGVAPDPADRTAQTVVTHRPDQLARMISAGLIGERARILVAATADRPTDPAAESLPLGSMVFRGSFGPSDSIIELSDGSQLQSRPYGAAEFVCFDWPTILWIQSADDLSAYLRDADEAWTTGRFAHHVTHHNAIIANLAAVGGAADRSGPSDRLFVFPDGGISTSPTGRRLGSVESSVSEIGDAWVQANTASAHPDATCLNRVIGERDRTDALRERPWIGRYVVVCRSLREIRRTDRHVSRASGFAARFAADLPAPALADPVDAPILLQLGSELQVVDPARGASLPVSDRAGHVLEAVLSLEPEEISRWWVRRGAGPEIGMARLVAEVIGELAGAGIARQWCDSVLTRWRTA